MDFKDLLNKYKEGNASAEQIKFVEEELNKHELIQEYLCEGYDITFEKDTFKEDVLKGNVKEETALVKRSVNKRLKKVIVASVSIVFLILFAIFYLISPILNNFYYNPSEKTVGRYNQDLYFDLRAFTELNLPGYTLNNAYSESSGFGAYNIYFQRRNLFTGDVKNINAKIKRNVKIGSFEDFFETSYLGFAGITQPGTNESEFLKGQKDRVINHIDELNPVSYISAYITFENDLTMKEFDELNKKYNNKISFKWVGVRIVGKGEPINYLSGFIPEPNDQSVTNDSADKDKYPALQLVDIMMDENNDNKYNMEVVYTKHFISLLKYMVDREKAVKVLDENNNKMEYYKDTLNYVENNGVNTYGVLVCGEARDLLEFINNEKVKTIEIDNVSPSKKYIH